MSYNKENVDSTALAKLDAEKPETWEAAVSVLKALAERLEVLLTERKIRDSGR